MNSVPHAISKTDFLNYLMCPGYAWHARYRKDLLPPLDIASQRRFRDGQRIETLAQQLFPTGVSVGARSREMAVASTQTALHNGTDVLFQATAVAETGVLARADVLVRVDGGWHLIEIKSSSTDPENPKTTIKKHLQDITFQRIAFRQAGVPIVQASLLVLNRGYRRLGEIVARDLFTLIDVTNDVSQCELDLMPLIEDATAVLLNGNDPARCDCHRKTRANRCGLFSYFHPEIPEKGSIYSIGSVQRNTLLPALDRGVLMMIDWPDDLKLSTKQQRQIAVARSGREHVMHDSIAEFLTALRSPLWYLDYETFQCPVPPWDGYAPHQQITFQYSLHCWDADFDEPVQFAYLADSAAVDPTEELLRSLAADLGPDGSVVVWNKSFEHSRNVEMAGRYPAYAEFLHTVNARMIDLADPVKHGWWEHPDFQGSWSLKQVLPVVAPDLDYKNLEIGDGGTASERWMQAVLDDPCELEAAERTGVLDALRVYCGQDTLAMHRIHRYMSALLYPVEQVVEPGIH